MNSKKSGETGFTLGGGGGSIARRRVTAAIGGGFSHERLDADLPQSVLDGGTLSGGGGGGGGRGGREGGSDFFPRVDPDDALLGWGGGPTIQTPAKLGSVEDALVAGLVVVVVVGQCLLRIHHFPNSS